MRTLSHQAESPGQAAPFERCFYVMLLVFTVFALFYSLGGRSIENKDYLRYAEISREILEYDDWVVLHRNDRLYVHKPPLHFWLMALSYRIFGINTFAARVPAALLGIAGVMGVAFFANRAFRQGRTALFSALLLLSCLGFYWWARRTRLDLTFGVLFSLAMMSFYLGWREAAAKIKIRWYGAYWGLLGLAFLVKAWICLLSLPVVIVFALVAAAKGWDGRWRIGWFALTSLVFWVPVSGWVVPLLLHPDCDAYFALLKRSGEHIFANRHGFFYYVPYLLVKLLPAMPFALLGLFWFLKGKAGRQEKPALFFACLWIGLCLVALQASPTRNARYLLIIYVPCCLMAGWALQRLWEPCKDSKAMFIRRLDLFFFVASLLSLSYPVGAAFYYAACWWKALLLVSGLAAFVVLVRMTTLRWARAPGLWLCLGFVFVQLAIEVGDWTRNDKVSDHLRMNLTLRSAGLSVKNTGFYKCAARTVEVQAYYFQKIPWQSKTLETFSANPACRGIVVNENICKAEGLAQKLEGFERRDLEKRCVLFLRSNELRSGHDPGQSN